MGDFQDFPVREKLRQEYEERSFVDVLAASMGDGNVDARTFFDGKGAADDVRLRRIERRLFFVPIRLVGRSFKIERHQTTAADIVTYAFHSSYALIFGLHDVFLHFIFARRSGLLRAFLSLTAKAR